MITMGNPQSETYVRLLRDKVFGKPSTDNNWEACKKKWMTPDSIQWLQTHAAIPMEAAR